MLHPHLHLPQPLGHEHDHALALAAAAVAATVAVSVGAARVIAETGSRLAGPASTEQTAVTVAPTAVAAGAVEASTVPASTAISTGPATAVAAAPAATAAPAVVAVELAEGMRLSRAWLETGSGARLPATSIGPAEARFDRLAAGVYTIGYQVETGATHAGNGAVISAAQAGWTSPVAVVDGASIVVSFSH
jgi:hypothetical protein